MMLGRVWQQVDLLLLGRLLFAFAFSTKFILVTRAVAAISNHTHLTVLLRLYRHTNMSHHTPHESRHAHALAYLQSPLSFVCRGRTAV